MEIAIKEKGNCGKVWLCQTHPDAAPAAEMSKDPPVVLSQVLPMRNQWEGEEDQLSRLLIWFSGNSWDLKLKLVVLVWIANNGLLMTLLAHWPSPECGFSEISDFLSKSINLLQILSIRTRTTGVVEHRKRLIPSPDLSFREPHSFSSSHFRSAKDALDPYWLVG